MHLRDTIGCHCAIQIVLKLDSICLVSVKNRENQHAYISNEQWHPIMLTEGLYRYMWTVLGVCTQPCNIAIHASGNTTLIARSWRQHGAHLGPTGPRWAPCWPHELCHLGNERKYSTHFGHWEQYGSGFADYFSKWIFAFMDSGVALTNGQRFVRRHIQVHFLERKWKNSVWIFPEILFRSPIANKPALV